MREKIRGQDRIIMEEKGHFMFNKKTYDAGLAWGMFVKVKWKNSCSFNYKRPFTGCNVW
ncbi:MAG: hypothetical protein ACUZ8H_09160 [Candidatus Anammoxibacter sp.]